MKIDRDKLHAACFEIARTVLWAQRPVSVTEIELLADRFCSDALLNEEFLVGQNRDPNLVTAAVIYLCNHHAIPPMGSDPQWFNDMLQVLIELCCPNQAGQPNEEPFFRELEVGIANSRADYAT